MHPEHPSEQEESPENLRPPRRDIPPVNLDLALHNWIQRCQSPKQHSPTDLILLFRGVGVEGENRNRIGRWWSESPRQAAFFEYSNARGDGTIYVAEATRAELDMLREQSTPHDPWVHQFSEYDPANARALSREELDTQSITFTAVESGFRA